MTNYTLLFDLSYERVLGDDIDTDRGAAFFAEFYARFLGDNAAVRERFAGIDMARQSGMLHKSMFHIVNFFVTGTDNFYLERIAESHAGIPDRLYDAWLDALVGTVAAFDDECDEDVLLAWRLALTPGITYLKTKSRPGSASAPAADS